MKNIRKNRLKRKLRIKKKINQDKSKKRLSVYRSGRYIYAQLIDDNKNITLLSASDIGLTDKKTPTKKTDKAKIVGERMGNMLIQQKIKDLVFDRNGYKYHGRVKALAEGIRSKGIKF